MANNNVYFYLVPTEFYNIKKKFDLFYLNDGVNAYHVFIIPIKILVSNILFDVT